MFGLADCNNFYVSCERVFQPDLARRPVIVLSNNDGCVVARSPEAKRLGIAMGVPLFQVRSIVERHDVAVLSSNYALYGDLSERVMSLFAAAAPGIEIYSIDECFLDLDRLAVPDLGSWLRDLRSKVHRWTGIPVSIGAGPTKTLAKLANRLAKSSPRTGGVLDLANNPAWIEPALSCTAAGDIWGIGPRRAKMLGEAGIGTALNLRATSDGWVRKRMGIVGLRTVHELRGIACHALETQPPAKQSTCVSRTFAQAGRDTRRYCLVRPNGGRQTARRATGMRRPASVRCHRPFRSRRGPALGLGVGGVCHADRRQPPHCRRRVPDIRGYQARRRGLPQGGRVAARPVFRRQRGADIIPGGARRPADAGRRCDRRTARAGRHPIGAGRHRSRLAHAPAPPIAAVHDPLARTGGGAPGPKHRCEGGHRTA